MNKIFSGLFMLMVATSLSFSQTCYHVIANMSGADISPYQAELDSAACQVKDTMPAEFQNDFGVFDFGFYRILETASVGFDEAWSDVIDEAIGQKSYNVIFGREITAEGGIDVNFRVKLNLPDTGELSCLTEQTIEGTENEMLMVLNQKNKPYHLKEIEAMRVFNALIQRTKDCCSGSQRPTLIDASLLEIQVCIDNCENKFAPENSVALIVNNVMPDIGFKLSYPQNLVLFCLELHVEVIHRTVTRGENVKRRQGPEI